MEQTKALNALEVNSPHPQQSEGTCPFPLLTTLSIQPFLALTKTATSPRAAADLISRATAAPNTYIFAELLAQPNIAALASSPDPEAVAWHTHLQLFSSGLYSTYHEHADPPLPALTPPQALKLRQLSLLTLSRDKTQLTYASLRAHLRLASARELEDVVISAVYAGLLTARLNPARQEVQVSSVAPLRDVPPSTVAGVVGTLHAWSARCDATLAELEATLARIRADAARAAEGRRAADRVVAAAVAAEEKSGPGGGTGAAGAEGVGGGGAGGKGRQRRLYSGASLRAKQSSASASGAAKRGSEKLMETTAGDDEDDEAMDLDDDGGDSLGQKRASRRKL